MTYDRDTRRRYDRDWRSARAVRAPQAVGRGDAGQAGSRPAGSLRRMARIMARGASAGSEKGPRSPRGTGAALVLAGWTMIVATRNADGETGPAATFEAASEPAASTCGDPVPGGRLKSTSKHQRVNEQDSQRGRRVSTSPGAILCPRRAATSAGVRRGIPASSRSSPKWVST